MSDPAVPDNLASRLRELEWRIRNLETSPRLRSSSVKGGALSVLDDNGQEVVHLGALVNGDGISTSGVTVTLQPSNKTVLWIDGENGIAWPYQVRAMERDTFTAVTSASFVSTHVGNTLNVPSDSMVLQVYAYVDAGTVGELRCTHNHIDAVNTPTAVRTVSNSGTVNTFAWNWRHGIPITGSASVHVEARRVSGAGNLYVGACVTGMGFTSHVTNSGTPTGV